MLTISNVSRRFGDKLAVSDVNLEIPQGQMVGIIGRSGAGKSTLLRMINRLTMCPRAPSDLMASRSRRCAARRCATGNVIAP